eukprot:TRINITY_DN6252_c0_g1_i2.p1 TRINITY_DN6252_c0_g1~~TRINITY_DN6252_c0_g1_i2.p1  ORF type:complete len:408 (-),score=52.32 TRINITY_DN6252_c0_g1_i2:4-1227(-)
MHRPLIMLLRNDFEYIADPDEDPAPIVFYKPYIPKQIHKRSISPTPPIEIHQRPDIDAVKQEKTEKPIEKPIIVTDNSYYWLPIPIWEFIMRKLSLIDLARCMQVNTSWKIMAKNSLQTGLVAKITRSLLKNKIRLHPMSIYQAINVISTSSNRNFVESLEFQAVQDNVGPYTRRELRQVKLPYSVRHHPSILLIGDMFIGYEDENIAVMTQANMWGWRGTSLRLRRRHFKKYDVFVCSRNIMSIVPRTLGPVLFCRNRPVIVCDEPYDAINTAKRTVRIRSTKKGNYYFTFGHTNLSPIQIWKNLEAVLLTFKDMKLIRKLFSIHVKSTMGKAVAIIDGMWSASWIHRESGSNGIAYVKDHVKYKRYVCIKGRKKIQKSGTKSWKKKERLYEINKKKTKKDLKRTS